MVFGYLFGIRGPSGFGSSSTCYDVAKACEGDVKGKVVMVTGATSGIGVHAAKALAQYGATVALACRNKDQMHAVAEDIRKSFPNSTVHELVCDLSSFESVRTCAEEFNKLNVPLDALINNAGVMMCPWMLTKDGYEMQFGTNHLGHFLLTNLLMPKLKEAPKARIVCVASVGHRLAPKEGVMFDYLKANEKYNNITYYGQSKLSNMLHARALTKKLQGTSVTAVSLHPGAINTNLGRHSWLSKAIYFIGTPFLKSEPQGAATNVYCAFGSVEPAGYYADCNVDTPAHSAYTDELADKLWTYSATETKSDI